MSYPPGWPSQQSWAGQAGQRVGRSESHRNKWIRFSGQRHAQMSRVPLSFWLRDDSTSRKEMALRILIRTSDFQRIANWNRFQATFWVFFCTQNEAHFPVSFLETGTSLGDLNRVKRIDWTRLIGRFLVFQEINNDLDGDFSHVIHLKPIVLRTDSLHLDS